MENDESYNVYSLSEIDIEDIMHHAEHGDAECLCALGYCYENGIKVEQNEVKAFELYCMAADQNFANGIYNKGVFIGFGRGGAKRNPVQYFNLIRQAAVLGFAPAQNDLGWCYEEGIKHGCVDFVDTEKAFSWYLKSARQGHHTGITNVIRCYREGIGTQRDEDMALKWENGDL